MSNANSFRVRLCAWVDAADALQAVRPDVNIEPRGRAQLEHMQQVAIGDLTACLVRISLVSGEATITALGVSRVGDAVAEAGARAVLDAVNRHLPHLMD